MTKPEPLKNKSIMHRPYLFEKNKSYYFEPEAVRAAVEYLIKNLDKGWWFRQHHEEECIKLIKESFKDVMSK